MHSRERKMKRVLIAFFVLVLSTCCVFAEKNQFIALNANGGFGYARVSNGNNSSSATSSSLGISFASGYENDDFNFKMDVGVGLGNMSISASYTKYFPNALFTKVEAGFGETFGSDISFLFSLGCGMGASFVSTDRRLMDIGLLLNISYQSNPSAQTAMFVGVLGLFMDSEYKVNDDLSMMVGMTVGSIPLITRLIDRQNNTAMNLSATSLAFSMRIGIKYSFPTTEGIGLQLRKR